MDILEKSKLVLGGITQLLTTSLRYLLLFKNICYTRKKRKKEEEEEEEEERKKTFKNTHRHTQTKKLYVAFIYLKKAFDLM